MSDTQSEQQPIAISRFTRFAVAIAAWFGFMSVLSNPVWSQFTPPGQGGYQQPQTGSYPQPQNNRVFNSGAAYSNAGPNGSAAVQPDLRLAANPNAAPTNATPSSGETATDEGKIPVRNLLQIFHDGGIMMYPIAICSFVLTVFSFERLINLRTGRVILARL